MSNETQKDDQNDCVTVTLRFADDMYAGVVRQALMDAQDKGVPMTYMGMACEIVTFERHSVNKGKQDARDLSDSKLRASQELQLRQFLIDNFPAAMRAHRVPAHVAIELLGMVKATVPLLFKSFTDMITPVVRELERIGLLEKQKVTR